jgi:egghead protein (zeste-white 4 protein)
VKDDVSGSRLHADPLGVMTTTTRQQSTQVLEATDLTIDLTPPVAPRPHLGWRNVRFRLGVVALMVGVFLGVRLIKAVLWADAGHVPTGLVEEIVRWAGITWALLLPWALADVLGWMLFRRHTWVTEEVESGDSPAMMSHLVSFRIVTRGDQPDVVAETVDNILSTMEGRPIFPFYVEVVTDIPITNLISHPGVQQIVVPEDYQTSNGATHKARALQFAIENSLLRDHHWILHLDEESHITEQLVVGIREAVTEEETSGEHRIGQGLILYHRDLETNPVFTLADSIRVADDVGRFHLQYRLNRVLFGMHGSFVLVRNSVEKEVGFDFSPAGCTTEDTTWGLSQMGAGNRFRWVEGTVVEQSPRGLLDFIRQRRRWFSGMWWAALHTPVALRHRLALIVTMALWTIGWFNLVYSWIHLASGVILPAPIAILGELVFTVYVANYLLGLWVSLTDRKIDGALARAGYLIKQVLWMPIHATIEAAAIVYALFKPEANFHVVAK